MTSATGVPHRVIVTRWVARVWSVVVAVLMVLMFVLPGTAGGPSEPIAPVDQFLLVLTAVAVLGLFVAWRWELVGGVFTIVMLFAREIAWVVLKGPWLVAFLFLWALIAPPAILFLVAWGLGRKPWKVGPEAAR